MAPGPRALGEDERQRVPSGGALHRVLATVCGPGLPSPGPQTPAGAAAPPRPPLPQLLAARVPCLPRTRLFAVAACSDDPCLSDQRSVCCLTVFAESVASERVPLVFPALASCLYELHLLKPRWPLAPGPWAEAGGFSAEKLGFVSWVAFSPVGMNRPWPA